MHGRLLLHDITDAIVSLRRRPLRSLLSSIGIGIGVAALIAMLSISEGAKRKALEKIASLGIDTLRVETSDRAAMESDTTIANLSAGLTRQDADKIKTWLGGKGTLGTYDRRGEQLVATDRDSATATVMGVNVDWFVAERLELAWGRIFDPIDLQATRNFAVVGATIARELNLKPGSTLKIGADATTVIGALAGRGSLLTEGTGLSALDFDQVVLIPAATVATRSYGYDHIDGLVIRFKAGLEQSITQISDQIGSLLNMTHRGVHDFTLVVPYSLLREARENQRIFSLVMGTIAGLSLLVGGIGVMNVMLANVSEQTREIGLRMSLGASRFRIIWLYLWNAMLLTLSGGLWGVAGGMVLAYLIQLYAGWDVAYSLAAVVLAPVSAVVTGIIFGLHPAIRAAELDPAAALREV